MPETVQRIVEQLRTLWAGLSWAQRAVALGVVAAAALGVLGLTAFGHRVSLTTLYANLSPADAGQIVEQLKSAHVPYRLEDSGTRILVPAEHVHESRLKLAAAGLPQGGGVGFELFDRSTFGATDFVQKLNYQRALQGELARTIGQIREVQQARVHLVLPQPSVFADRERRATASVVLSLRGGARLGGEQVRAIVHLVSGSVEGLSADDVTIIDTAGRVLSQRAEHGLAGAASQYERQAAVEAELQRRVQSMLEEVLGPGKASVRVAAQLELSHGERTEERVDPAAVVKSEQRSSETSKSASTRPGGAPGTAANLGTPGAASAGAGSSQETLKEQESVQYEVGRVVERRTLPAGELKRLSVAVLVDPPYRTTQAADGTARKEALPRSRGELETLRAMVMKAIGFNAARGDEVEVAELAFDTSVAERERGAAERAERQAFWWSLVRPGVTVLGLLLAALAALRVLRGVLAGRRLQPGTHVDLTEPALAQAARAQLQAKAAAALNPAQMVKAREREELHGRIADLAQSQPEQMAQLLRSWMLRSRA
ncbi:MAG: flagellar basal-body MS-ring/collar protein FliF [Candidatus Methylomirabilales bacterium]